jgi:hypothetical protein
MTVSFWREQLFGVNAMLPATALAVMLIGVMSIIPAAYRVDLLALQLIVIAAVYLGFGVNDGRYRPIMIEVVAFFGFLALTLLGMWWNPLMLVVGYIGHGLWDMLHDVGGIQTRMARWYPPACVIYDWLFAAAMLIWLL